MADNKVNSGLLEFSEDQKVFVALDAETSEVKKAVTIDGDGVETDIAGGGGGDFSTVEVEMVEATGNGFLISGIVIISNDDEIIPLENTDNGVTYSVVLYKGTTPQCRIVAPEGFTVSNAVGTGGVSVEHAFGGYEVTITGAGTLTVTLAANN